MSLRREIQRNVNSIPPMPEVIVKLRQYVNDPEVDYKKLAGVIEKEPGLTANILRLANSSYFGGVGQIRSIQLAMTRLGLRRIHQMAVAVCIEPLAKVKIKGYDLGPRELWEHSLATALASAKIAQHLGLRDTSDAFTVGLLHDLGKTVLGNFIDVDMDAIMDQVKGGEVSFDEAERSVLGMDHAEVAGILLQNWKLPQEIVDAVRWHHRPALFEGDDDSLVSIVHIADVLCMDVGFGIGADGLKYRLDEAVGLKYKMKPEIGEKIMSMVLAELAEMMQMFSTSGEESSDVSEYTHS